MKVRMSYNVDDEINDLIGIIKEFSLYTREIEPIWPTLFIGESTFESKTTALVLLEYTMGGKRDAVIAKASEYVGYGEVTPKVIKKLLRELIVKIMISTHTPPTFEEKLEKFRVRGI